jgi:hypothetical protein
MRAAANATGVSAARVADPEPATELDDRASFTWGECDKREAKHLAAVARSLRWADESAQRGDHLEAVTWLEMVEAIGDELPEAYEIRRDAWLLALGTDARQVEVRRAGSRTE